MKDPENLVRIDRSEREIVVRIAAVVEVESAQQVEMQQPRDNLLDVLREVVMAGVDQHEGLRAGRAAQVRRHAPVGNVGVVEGGLEGLVFDEQPLIGRQVLVCGTERVLQPLDALAHGLRAGIVGAVGKPERDIARAETLGDLDGIENVLERVVANLR